jgi:hypothetical protein
MGCLVVAVGGPDALACLLAAADAPVLNQESYAVSGMVAIHRMNP